MRMRLREMGGNGNGGGGRRYGPWVGMGLEWRWWWTQEGLGLDPLPLGQEHLWIAPGGQGSGKVTSGPRPPVDGAAKSRSLPVRDHDLQAGDRSAPPHSPPLPLPQILESGRARTRVPHCSLIDVQEDVLAWPAAVARRPAWRRRSRCGRRTGRRPSAQRRPVAAARSAAAATREAPVLRSAFPLLFQQPRATVVNQLRLLVKNPQGGFQSDQVLWLTALPG